MSFARAAAASGLALLLAACAASGPRFAEVEPRFPQLRSDHARVFFYRENGAWGAALTPEVRLDGQLAGKLRPGSFVYMDAPAGRHQASVTGEVDSSLEIALREGETAYLTMTISLGVVSGRPHLVRKAAGEARQALGDLAYAGSAAPAAPAPTAAAAGAATPARGKGPVTMDDLRGLLPPAR